MAKSGQAEFNTIKTLEVNQIGLLISKHWFNILLIYLFIHILFNKDVSFQFNINSANNMESAEARVGDLPPSNTSIMAMPTAYSEENTKAVKKKKKKKWKDRKANTFSNLTFVLSPDYGERHNVDPAIVKEKIGNCKNYVKRYAKIALEEQKKFGIPASITLAQGLLESNAGDSRLSVESNNHFGIKCRRKCRGCTCRNYTDDDIYDMFRVFDTVWESYREHSKLLQGDRYKKLLRLDPTDYESWAHGLKKAGYATDKRYAYKLIKIIEELKLYRFDA